MASGLPVAAYRSAAAAELVKHQENGTLASPGDEVAYIEAALWLAADRERLAQLSLAARQTMLPRNWAAVVKAFERVAHEAIGI
jgi:glycosyltransferase involved in cell wall biosynthesis